MNPRPAGEMLDGQVTSAGVFHLEGEGAIATFERHGSLYAIATQSLAAGLEWRPPPL